MRKTIYLLTIAVMMLAEAGATLSGQPQLLRHFGANDTDTLVNEIVIAGKAGGPVEFLVKAPGSISLNDTGRVEVVFSFEEGWYGYAETPGNLAAGWVPTKVGFELPEGFEKNGEPIVPACIPKGGAEVYSGNEVKFILPFKYTARGKDGKMPLSKERVIKVTVHYQTCDEEKCLPPQTETVDVKIFGR